MAKRYKHFPFAGGVTGPVTKAQYRGVLILASGIMRQSMKERIQMAHATPTTLQSTKLLFAGVDLYYMKIVYCTLIQSKTDCALFLCPYSTVSYHAFESLLQGLFQRCIGMKAKKSQIP